MMLGTEQEITPDLNLIDSRDVIARIATIEDMEGDEREDATDEYEALVKLAAEAADYAEEWKYGVTLIRDTHFTEYAKDFAEDIGAFPASGQTAPRWPMNFIDWGEAAEDLMMDYSAVEFMGQTYYVQ